MVPAPGSMAGRDTTMAGDLAGDITRHFDGMAVTASLNPWHRLAAGVNLEIMAPDQIQQMTNGQMSAWLSAFPFWMKVLFGLQVLSVLMTAVCLPLITWKLYFGKKSVPAATMSPVEQVRLQQIRDRRESLQTATGATRWPVRHGLPVMKIRRMIRVTVQLFGNWCNRGI